MATTSYKSPGVYASEIDLTGPVSSQPVGVPAGVIGTANEGPAFIPLTVGSYNDFSAVFGSTDGEKFGPLAVNQFLKNAQSLTYLRVLGIGDGKARNASTGIVTRAGFVVGQRIVQSDGVVGNNDYAVSATGVKPGRTYFLGCYMSESLGSTIFSSAGIQGPLILNGSGSHPIIRAVLMAPSGVIPMLSNSWDAGSRTSTAPDPTAAASPGAATLQGTLTGSVNLASQQFVILLNGFNNPLANVITASFDVEDAAYFANRLNTDPTKIEEKGHFLYAHYDIHPALAKVTGSGVITVGQGKATPLTPWTVGGVTTEPVAFITTSAIGRNSGTSAIPNYETFRERFTHPVSSFVTSQDFGGTRWDLFRVHSLGDGSYNNTNFKISIENLVPSKTTKDPYGTFDLIVRKWSDTDLNVDPLESFRGLTLDPSSDKFIGRAIGDMYTFFDFDQSDSSQKIVVRGNHPIMSNFIRIEQSSELSNGQLPKDAMPFGFRGVGHLVTSGSGPLATMNPPTPAAGFLNNDSVDILKRSVQPPIPFRENIAVGTIPNKRTNADLYWGIQFMQKTSLSDLNSVGLPDPTVGQWTTFFPSFDGTNMDFFVSNNPGKGDSGGTVLDCDRFNNDAFNMERIQVRTGSDTKADPAHWASASYVRGGNIVANPTTKTRALTVADMNVQGNRKYGKFTLILQGGFDGTMIFNRDKDNLTNTAALREMNDSTSQGGVNGPTVSAYRKALDIMGTKSDVDIKLLAIPGLRDSAVTNYAITTVENRFDAMYIMDISEQDEMGSVITSSISSIANVSNTATAFKGRALDTSFAAAYFPDVDVTDPTTNTNVQCPPSVAVLGAFALNDAVGYPWFAPAGFSRGSLGDNVTKGAIPLNRANMDDLYDADINPLTSFPGNAGMMVFGQKTLQAASSALDRVNVRRLLIDVRRKVRAVANMMLFEPNRQETLDKFSSLVQPILQSIQERSGVERFKVVIDATTTTQADIENNTLRGKIFLQPTRTAEFVALDFVLTNAGDAFDNA